MGGITRRAILAVPAVGVAAASSSALALPENTKVEGWWAQIQVIGYFAGALVFERPEGKLVVEPDSEHYRRFSPGRSLGGRAYFAPPEMRINLVSKVEVPSLLLDSALAISLANSVLTEHEEFLPGWHPFKLGPYPFSPS